MKYLYLSCGESDALSAEQLAILSEHRFDQALLERKSGKRETLGELLGRLGAGDCLVVESFASVAGSSRMFLALMAELMEKGVDFQSLREGVDTAAEQGKFLLGVCGELLQLDKKHRRERQREGIEQAKEDGRYKGRRPIAVDDDKLDEAVARWQRGEITAKAAMKEVGLKPNTFYRRIKQRETAQ